MDRVLVACPNYEGKAYSLAQWWGAYKAFTYPEREAFMVDNTQKSARFLHRIRELGIPAIHIEPYDDPSRNYELFMLTLEECWRAILARALKLGCAWVASIEADTICPPETLDVLRSFADNYDVVGHDYPTRGCWQGERMIALGCTLIRAEWLESRIDYWYQTPEFDIWHGARRLELDGFLDTKHLDPPEVNATPEREDT